MLSTQLLSLSYIYNYVLYILSLWTTFLSIRSMMLTLLFELIPLDWPTQLLLRIITCEDKGLDHLGWEEHLLYPLASYCVCLFLITRMAKTFHVRYLIFVKIFMCLIYMHGLRLSIKFLNTENFPITVHTRVCYTYEYVYSIANMYSYMIKLVWQFIPAD